MEGGENEIHNRKWHHVGGSYDGKAMRAYIDGVKKGIRQFPSKWNDPQAPAYLDSVLTIGTLNGGSHGFPEQTLIDEVAIFSYALDEKEIKSAMELGLAKKYKIYGVNPGGKLATTWAKLKVQ